MTLLDAAKAALEALNCSGEADDPGHRCGHCDEYVDRNGVVRTALRSAIDQAQSEVMKHAEITAYELSDGRKLQRRRQLDGTMKWSIHDSWLSAKTQLEEAPWNIRFDTAELAYEAWTKLQRPEAGG